ncbi:MAG: FkbM family methyltransferase [Pseudomonadota bacterium]
MDAMISYAQNFEDVILERIFKGKEKGFYVDIGACHPVYDSVTYHFYRKGWNGINVEPQPALFTELVSLRERDINLKCCAGQQAGQMTLAITADIGTSTLDLDLAEEYSRCQSVVETISVELVTLDQIWAEHVGERPVDFLKIDVEGFEQNVLLGADLERISPSVIVIEATRPNSNALCYDQWEYLLLEHYEFFYFDGLNRFYQRKGFVPDQRASHISPNIFDHFKVYPQVLLEQANATLLKEKEALSTQLQGAQAQLVCKENALAEATDAYQALQANIQVKNDELQHAQELLKRQDIAHEQLNALLLKDSGEFSGQLAEAASAYQALQAAFQAKHDELLHAQELLHRKAAVRGTHAGGPAFDASQPQSQGLLERFNAVLLNDREELSEQLQGVHDQLASKERALAEAANAYHALQAAFQTKEDELSEPLQGAHAQLANKEIALAEAANAYHALQATYQAKEDELCLAQALLKRQQGALSDASQAYQQLVIAYENLEKEIYRKDAALADAAEAHRSLKVAFDEKIRELTALYATFDSASQADASTDPDTH